MSRENGYQSYNAAYFPGSPNIQSIPLVVVDHPLNYILQRRFSTERRDGAITHDSIGRLGLWGHFLWGRLIGLWAFSLLCGSRCFRGGHWGVGHRDGLRCRVGGCQAGGAWG